MYRKFLYLLFMVFSFLLLQDCGDFKNNSDKVNSAVEIADRQSNTSAPTVSSTYPSDSASSVAPNTSLTVTFSEAMDTTTITTNSSGTSCLGTLQLSSDSFSTCVQMFSSPTASDSNKTFSLEPASNLSYNSTYKVKVITDAKDSAGNALASAYTHSTGFTTSSTPDTTAPTVSSSSPADSATSVSVSSTIAVTFSEAMDTTSVTTNISNTTCSGSLQVSSDSFSTCVQMSSSPSISNLNKTFTVTPASSLSYSTTYKIRVTTASKDSAANALSSQWATSTGFTTDTWAGTKQLGSSSEDKAYGVATDSSGNVYVAGKTTGGLDGNTSAGNSDLFLVKYNSSGTKQWTQQLGTSSGDSATGVAIDLSGNVYVAGGTSGGLDGTNAGGGDLFLVKYNSSGTKQWTKQLGSSANDDARGVVTGSSGNVHVVGRTHGALDGNSFSDGSDFFIITYDSSGTKQWSKQLGTSRDDWVLANDAATDSSGNIYVIGDTSGALDGNSHIGGYDIFVFKYDSSGNKIWSRQLGTNNYDFAQGVATDSSGNVYVTGYTGGEMDGTKAGDYDLFLVKYNSSGTKQWTKQLGTSSEDKAYGVATDSSGNVYVAGKTTGGLDGNTNAGNSDLFLVKYNSSGTKQWTQQLGTSSADSASGVATDSSANVYVTGQTAGGLDGNTNAGSEDLFLVKYNSSGTKQ